MLSFVEYSDLRSQDQLSKIREALSKLPPAHYQTLRYLLAHLVR